MTRHTLMTRIAALLLGLVLLLPLPAEAQEDGQGFLTRLLQDSLSDAGRSVQIEGFRGALSSRATLDRLTIADDEGIWLELTGAVLDWNRSALLRGRLEINELTADTLTLTRLPEGDGGQAEASGFAIPELPVAVDIGQLSIGQLVLEEPVIGERAVLAFGGRALLDDGHLETELSLDRIDRAGQITLLVDFDPVEERLMLDIAAEEPEDGITARLLDLPGRPSLALSVQGEGPLDDFTADLRLASDGADRLAGQVTLRGTVDGARAFAADLGGDLTPVLLPRAQEFLGDEVQLSLEGRQATDGALSLDRLELSAARLSLSGSLATTAEGRPQRFDLTGRIAAPDGAPVPLPFGTDLSVGTADITARFDAAEGEDVNGRIALSALSTPEATVDSGTLEMSGRLDIENTPSVDLDLVAALTGVQFADAGLQQALGSELTARTEVLWTEEGTALELRGLDLQGTGYGAQFDASLVGGGRTSILTLEGRAELEDLSRFALLSGQDLSGQADLAVDLSADLLGGSFSLETNGTTTALALGIDALDPAIGGDAELALAVSRSPEGISLDTFDLSNDEITLEASGTLSNEAGQIDYAARLRNSGVFTGVDGGPVELSGRVDRSGETFVVTLDGGGRDLTTGIDQVDRLLRGEAAVAARLTINDQIMLDRAEVTTPGLELRAAGELTAGARQLTATGRVADSGDLTGAPSGPLRFSLEAREVGDSYLVTLDGTATELRTGVDQADALLRGTTTLVAEADIGSELLLNRLDVSNPAIRAQATGVLTEGARDVTLTVQMPDSGVPLGAKGGPLELQLQAVQDGAGYLLDLQGGVEDLGTGQALADSLLAGRTEITARGRFEGGALRLDMAEVDGRSLTASASGTIADGETALEVSARLASLAGVVPQAPAGPVSGRGTVAQSSEGGLRLDLTADGPGGTNARVAGRVGLPGGAVALDISGTAPLALANPYIRPRSLTGTARFDLAMSGQPGLSALSGQVTLVEGRAAAPLLGLAVDGISGRIGLSGGRAQLDVTGRIGDGGLSINGPVTLSGSYPADLLATLTNVPITRPGLVSTRVNGQVTVQGGLTGGGVIGGRIGLRETELRIPSGGFGGAEAIPEIRHVNEGAASRETRARAGLTGGAGGGGGGASGGLGLALRIEAETPVFLRGRGVDAELTGGLTLEGTTNDIRPVGQFDLVRGRIDILTKRLTLDEGRVRLVGSFDPVVRLVAESQAGEYAVQIILDGPVAEPEVLFTSRPELPEDEVLSQLFFERDITSLSPFQAARMALAIAELTGRGGGGLVGSIRDGAGLDDLDVSQTRDGETALSAGKYISENVYSEVEATSGGKTSLSINLDISKSLTAKGKVGSDGDSSLGLFFERDY
ncbi:translocation/assembly module TamB domain-containing protein [Pseudooceanicola sp.]|uniref:translocation/assembly module TamB domain-containing protein n=2 Tax=Pseudooceanicola sp. TaxID=1914328 RepID=UPI0035C76E67